MTIRLARPWLDEDEERAAVGVLRSGMLVQGERVAELERALAAICERKYAIACGTGTAALELALASLNVRGEVLCPALSWPSPAHAIRRVGATPRLVDVGATWNAAANDIANARSATTSAAIVIDQFGMPAAHEEIAPALDGLPVIVDAACAIGSTLEGRPSASYGVLACLSFHPRKLVTTGEGGAVLTDDPDLAARLRTLRNHGQQEPGVFVEVGGNQRLSEVSAAIGIAQLAKLEKTLVRRRVLAARYREALAGCELQAITPGAVSNWQTLGVVLESGQMRDQKIAHLRERDIEAGRLSYSLSTLPSLASSARSCPNAERIASCGLALPLHPLMSDEDQARVIEAFR